MAVSKKVVVGLDIQTGKFIRGVTQTETKWKQFRKSIFSVKNAIGAVFAGVAVRSIANLGGNLVKAAENQLEAESKLAAALRERNLYTQQNMNLLTDYAAKMQYVALVNDEEVMTVQRMLIQYGIWGDELRRATKLVLDMGASGNELAGSADLIGRAFLGATEAVSRYGATKELVEKMGGGFIGVLKAMESLKRGQAEALSDTALGNLKRMQLLWGDIKESVGMGLVESIAGIGSELGATSGNLKDMGASLGKIVASGAEAFFFDVAAGLTAIVAQIQRLNTLSNVAGGPGKWALNLITTGKPFAGGFDFSSADRSAALAERLTERAEGAYQKLRGNQIDAALAQSRRSHEMLNTILSQNKAFGQASRTALLASSRR